MNNKRRPRGNQGRSKSPDQPRHQGVYTNQNFTTTAAALIGCHVQVNTTDGMLYTGVYSSFSSQFEVALEFAQVHSEGANPSKDEHIQRVIINAKNIVSMAFKNVDPKYATGDSTFQTDSCISKYDRNGLAATGEKELQPWISECNGDDIDLSLGSDPGWDANAMFKRNEERYGVRSSFDHSLSGYTTAIERSDSKGFKEAEARAARIASEIERSTKSQAHAELENGDEEERFAAVVRPNDDRNSPPRSQDKGKYIPPIRRQGGGGKLAPRSAPFPPGHVSSAPALNEDHHERHERRSEGENGSAGTQMPTNISDDSRNNNSCSPSTVPVASSHPPPMHARNNNSNINNNGGRGKPYAMQPGYTYSQPPRYAGPAGHPPSVQHRPMPPGNQQPPVMQHGPPPSAQQMPSAVYTQQLPPNHVHHNSLPAAMAQDVSQQPMQVQSVPTHPANQNVNVIHTIDGAGLTHVHMPPHGVQHPHHVSVPAGYAPAPRDHDAELRGHRNAGIRGPAPRPFQPNNKRFASPQFQAPPPRGKTRMEEVNDLVDFSSNLKLANSESEPEVDEKHGSPPLEWAKGRSPPSNSSAEDAAKKSTLNPNAKEFNPSAKSFTPRPPNTPGQSRPHTPQTPAQQFGYSPGPVPAGAVIMPGTFVMQPAFPHQATPPRLQMAQRPDISSSQMQVAAATGQPLLAPAPLQRFVAPYPNPPPQQYQQMVRMVPGQGPVVFHEGSHHVQYMSPHGQPHPAGQFQQTHPQQFPVVYPMPLTQTTMIQYFQQPPQPGQQPQLQVIVPNHSNQ